MQLKPITAIIVLSLVVASLLVSGCSTFPITSTPTPTPTSTPSSIPMVTTPTPSSTPSSPSSSSSHNATLEKMVASVGMPVSGWITTARSVVWQGNDAVTISFTGKADVQNAPNYSTKVTLMIFPTTQGATNYLNAFDKSGYNFTTVIGQKPLPALILTQSHRILALSNIGRMHNSTVIPQLVTQ
jgi:hypothetical protein